MPVDSKKLLGLMPGIKPRKRLDPRDKPEKVEEEYDKTPPIKIPGSWIAPRTKAEERAYQMKTKNYRTTNSGRR